MEEANTTKIALVGTCQESKSKGFLVTYTKEIMDINRTRLIAEQGNATSQFVLGKCYLTGLEMEQDYAQSVKWFLLAAEQKHAEAQFELGCLFSHGVKKKHREYAEAVKWFRLSSEQGHAGAQCALGSCLMHGNGVRRNTKEAHELFRLSADQGHAGAHYCIGLSYEFGGGVEQDNAKAYMWHNLAATMGLFYAKRHLKKLKKRMTPEEISNGERMVSIQ